MTRVRVLIVVLAVVPLGCSFYYSSESSVKTLASPFTSSAGSSGGGDKQAYRDDVRDYTAAYVRSGGDVADFERGLGDVARRHGVSDWEGSETTYAGVGAGLAKAKVGAAELAAYKATLGRSDPAKASWIQHGYDAGR